MTIPFLSHWANRWAAASQHTARRNAMIATTALTQRRVERVEVEEFLASLAHPATSTATPARSAHG